MMILIIVFGLFLSVAASADIVASLNSRGDTVVVIQSNLNKLEYLTRKPTGKFDKTTVSAVKKFQTANTITVTGAVDDVTYDALNSDDAIDYPEYIERLKDEQLVPGGRGAYVKPVEKRLKKLGYGTLRVDTLYNEDTVEAVMLFQEAHALPKTGAVDRPTRVRLHSTDAKKYSTYLAENHLTTLKKGMRGAQVTYITTQLTSLGYLAKATIAYSASVRKAVVLFQTANGISATGVANRATRELLNAGGCVDFATFYNAEATREIALGDSGYAVEILQTLLNDLEYYTGAINGVYTASVKNAVAKFQSYNSITATGAADKATRVAMLRDDCLSRSDVEGLKPGDKSQAVLDMLYRLRKLGYYTGSKTTKYTSTVASAVKLFQKAHGLTQTGTADGLVTLPLIFSDEAKTYDSYRASLQGGDKVNKMIAYAEEFLGRPYRSDCNPPKSFDCSRYTRYVLSHMGISVSGEVTTQGNTLASRYGRITDMTKIQRGDILFFSSNDKKVGHSAICYTYKNGRFWFIHASSSAGKVVVSDWNDYYTRNWQFAVRIWK